MGRCGICGKEKEPDIVHDIFFTGNRQPVCDYYGEFSVSPQFQRSGHHINNYFRHGSSDVCKSEKGCRHLADHLSWRMYGQFPHDGHSAYDQ